MSHKEQINFVERLKEKYPDFFNKKQVLEIGSLYLNGTIRTLFKNCNYVGLDIIQGPCVDIVCPGQNYNAPDKSYDVVCSTECFEHTSQWFEIFKNMIRLCKSNGLIFFTCASEGRLEHGTHNNDPGASLLTLDYYKNLNECDFTSRMNFDEYFSEYFFEYNKNSCDLYFFGIKNINHKKHKQKIVQIGSNIGNDSLTKYLEQTKTELEFAILVEPNLLHIDKLKSCYSKFNNIIIENIAIKPSFLNEHKLTLYYYEEDAPLYAVSSCNKEHIKKHYLNFNEEKLHSFEVFCLTIDELFQKYNIIDLDWLLLDVEGIDAELLLTTDWSKYNIQRIEYEHLHLGDSEEKINKMFKNLGYIKTQSIHHYDTAWTKNMEKMTMEITLYAICKNEEKNIEKFIENSKKFSHTIVVDTGSTDKTVELLKKSGIEVYQHSQTREEFDFANARNQALSYVKTDWAFSLDFNEDLEEFFPSGLDVISNEFTAFRHERYDKEGENEPTLGQASHIRFHRTKNYTWVNAVHETPMFIPTEEYLNEVVVDTTIKITKNIHNTIDKELFYLSICEREYEQYQNTYYLWFIFKHYYQVKNFQKAVEFGQEYLNLSEPYFDPMRVDVFIMISICLIQLQDIQKASNYAFHALSEAMNLGGDLMGKAFTHLLNIGKLTQNPNIIVFASGFSEETLNMKERTDAIDRLFLTNLDDIPTNAWRGHRKFAEWLVSHKKPEVIVDLGVDYGLSTLSFSVPRIGHTYGIDNFIGDDFIGSDKSRIRYDFIMMKRKKLHLEDNLTIIEGDFNEVASTWNKKIDILHIDGSHHYEDVKRDFETWSKFVNDNGVILLHDTCIETFEGNEYGVKKFFDEIKLPKTTFTHSFGLGVVSKDTQLIKLIESKFGL